MKYRTFQFTSDEKQRLLDRFAEFFRDREEVEFAYIYGSFVEGLPFSDIDVGVYVSGIQEEKATFYALDLGQKLEKETMIPVDARVLNFATIPFLYHVIRGRMVFERNDGLRARVTENTIMKYLDLKPVIRRGTKEAFTSCP